MINITMTACQRPEVLSRTLHSFRTMFNNYKDCRLIINVDPVGWGEAADAAIFELARFYFERVACRFPPSPSFGSAFRWAWQAACDENNEADYIFHLEDDWELQRPIVLQELIDTLESEPDLALLRLPAFYARESHMKNWNKFYPWNGKYFECPAELKRLTGFCGHPSLIKREFVEKSAPLIDPNSNPEKQFHYPRSPLMAVVEQYRYGVWGPQNNRPAIVDIGRNWIASSGWRKQGPKAHFTTWEKTNYSA